MPAAPQSARTAGTRTGSRSPSLRRTPVRRAALAAAGLLALAAAGCSGEDVAERLTEEALERSTDGNVELDLDEDGGMAIESSEGTLRTGGGELPASFPEEVPTPPDDYEVLSSFEQTGEDQELELQVSLVTSGTVDDLVAYFEEALAEAGFEVEMHQRLSQDGMEAATMSGRGEEYGVLLQIVNDGEDTMVNYGIGAAQAAG